MGSIEQVLGIIIGIVAVIAAIVAVLIPPAIAILINFIISKHMEKAAALKGHHKVHAFAMCFWLGLPGYLYVVALPDVNQQAQLESIVNMMQLKNGIDTPEKDSQEPEKE